MHKHISTYDLDQYLIDGFTIDELSAFDSHIRRCDECRRMAMSREGLVLPLQSLYRKLSARRPSHLNYSDIEGLADNTLSNEELKRAEEHLSNCNECREDVDHLLEFARPAPTYISEAVRPASGLLDRFTPILSGRGWSLVPALGIIVVVAAAVWFLLPRQPSGDQSQITDANDTTVAPTLAPETNGPITPAKIPDVAPVSEQLTLAIKDGGLTVGIDANGELIGYEGRSNKQDELLRSALLRETVVVGAEAKDVEAGSDRRMGEENLSVEESIRPVSPVGKILDTSRPVFSWRPVDGVEFYSVEVYDLDYNKVASSGELKETRWMAELPRGRTYVWKVIGVKNGQEVRLATRREARFRTLDAVRSRDIAAIRKRYPRSHLLLGLAYSEAGMISEARKEIEALQRTNPNSPILRKILAQLRRPI